MPRSWGPIVLCLLLALGLGSSRGLTLCVHDAHFGVELSWGTCCESAACCAEQAPAPAAAASRALAADACCAAEAAPPATDSQEPTGHAGAPDGCQDYTLCLGEDWQPASGALPLALARPVWPELLPSPLCPAPLVRAPREPRGVPPPPRSDRSPILRC